MKRITLFCSIALGLGLLTSCHSTRTTSEPRPVWISQPKTSDSVYIYVVGHAIRQTSEIDARNAAYQDALQKLAGQIFMPDGRPVRPSRIRDAEIMPGCRYVEEVASGYQAWVQVSYPVTAKQKLIQQAEEGSSLSGTEPSSSASPGSASSPNDKGTAVGVNGGVVENAQAGIKMTIPPSALQKTVVITIAPMDQHPPLFDEPLPPELAKTILIGPAVDLGPSGTQFKVPVKIQWQLPEEMRARLREKGVSVEVGYYNGEIWQPFQNVQTTPDGLVSFETTHFTAALPILVTTVITAGGVALNYGAQLCLHPEKWIKADSPAIKAHIKAGNVNLPDAPTLAKGGTIPLNMGRSFTPYSYWFIPQLVFGDGEAMLTQRTACCQEGTFFTASILRASGDPRFQKFICVQGGVTDPKTGEKGGHMWMEIEIDGKIWVVDTAGVGNLSLMSKEEAYRIYKLVPGCQFTDAANSRTKYVGLAKPTSQAPDTTISQPTPTADPTVPTGKSPTPEEIKNAYQEGYDLGKQIRNGSMSMDDVRTITRDKYGATTAGELRASFRKGYAEGSAQ